MPCTVDPPTPAERAAASQYFEKTVALFDRLTHRNDVLREIVLNPKGVSTKALLKAATDDFKDDFKEAQRLNNRAMYASPDHKYMEKATAAYTEFQMLVSVLTGDITLSADEAAEIFKTQRAHRVEDLKRLAKVAIDNWDMELLKNVTTSSPDFPLENQLGFDPDSM